MSALDKRIPGQALAVIIPPDAGPTPVNLFGASLGLTYERRFARARLHRIGGAKGVPEQEGGS